MDASQTLVSTLKGFGINAEIAEVQRGAAVDRYALSLAPGTKVSAVTKLSDDVALALGARGVRISPIPGTKHVGVEIPADERAVITLETLTADLEADHPLRVPVGLAVDGSGISCRIDRLPHLLIAGTTGSGKSVWLTSILAHLVTTASPAQVQVLLVDPKRVELASFAGIRHLAAPVATEVSASIELLNSAVAEMEDRYDLMERRGVRNVAELGEDAPPYLVIAVEEMADLMMTAGKAAEASIVRLLQVGRAAGVHLLLATQRPSADVVTGLIRANVPSRLTMSVQSHHDSKIALGMSGAEALLGQGDALWFPSGASAPERVQAPFLSTEDLDAMLAPLRIEIDDEIDPTDPLGDLREASELPSEPEPACGERGVEVPGREHVCECVREWHTNGSHRCECGAYWNRPTRPPAEPPGEPEPTVPTAPSVPTPSEPSPYGLGDPRFHGPGAAPESVTEPAPSEPAGPFPPQYVPPTYPRDMLEEAFRRGREYGQVEAAQVTTERALRTGDWWLIALVVGLVTFASVFIFPVLPLAAGAWAGWAVGRRRKRDLRPVPYKKRRPPRPAVRYYTEGGGDE